jgi:hypothetical protein
VVILRKRQETAPVPAWIWQDTWVAVIGAYAELRIQHEPELLRSVRMCEATILQVANAESAEAAEALSTGTLGTRSGPILVRAIRSGHPDIVRAKLLEDFHRTLWPEAVARGQRELPGELTLDAVLDENGRDELEGLCFQTLRRYASDTTWEVVVESAAYDTEARPNPQFAEVLRRRLA